MTAQLQHWKYYKDYLYGFKDEKAEITEWRPTWALTNGKDSLLNNEDSMVESDAGDSISDKLNQRIQLESLEEEEEEELIEDPNMKT